MPWTRDDAPDSWKNQPDDVRAKAIEIGNALLDDGMSEDRAVPIALSQARKALGVEDGGGTDQWVVPHDDGWAVKPTGADQATAVHDTKDDAIDHAVRIARNQASSVTVQGRDGTIQARQSFRPRL